jgi:quercetin dioxygenase-like cupin family protein
MRKQLLNLLLCVLLFLAGCAGEEGSPTALKMTGDATDIVELQKVLRRAHQHEVITDDWGTLSWLASKPLGNAEGLTVGLATIKPGKTNPRHRHPKSEEVLYVLKGRINHTLGDKTITMSAGDVITITPGVIEEKAKAVYPICRSP